jgi:hypothetical protein
LDHRLAEYQLRVIEITYRAQVPRGELGLLRQRAYEILDRLEREATGEPELLADIRRVRAEVSGQAAL